MKILNWKLFLESLVGDISISNYDNYISGMNTTLNDKLFFIHDLNFDVIVDFGCADGTFLKELSKHKPNVRLIGYDLDKTMLNKASNNVKNAFFTDNWNEVLNEIKKYKSPLLNLSSVIHEVYSYSHPKEINRFWKNQVFGGYFKYITIRDMIPSIDASKISIDDYQNDIKKVKDKYDKDFLNSFIENWDNLESDYRHFLHFLLKYNYTDNWDREVKENYVPVSLETMKSKIPSNYKITYEKSYILDYLKKKVKSDFNIDIKHNTHLKMIIKKL
jgi:hypothetical protein